AAAAAGEAAGAAGLAAASVGLPAAVGLAAGAEPPQAVAKTTAMVRPSSLIVGPCMSPPVHSSESAGSRAVARRWSVHKRARRLTGRAGRQGVRKAGLGQRLELAQVVPEHLSLAV